MNPQATARERQAILLKLRCWIAFFIVALVLSGVTAFPLLSELKQIASVRGIEGLAPDQAGNGLDRWILTVEAGLNETHAKHPWLAYGTDWLAFAHIVIAIFFIGVFVDPVRNVWILHAGVIACALVIPLALVCGSVRQIPFGWRLIDCSFGVFGVIPLLYALRLVRALNRLGIASQWKSAP